jgi:ATP-binding cassette subfamily B protein
LKKQSRKRQGLVRLIEIAGQKKVKLVLSGFLAAVSAILGFIPFIIIYLVIVELLSPPIEQAYVIRLAWIAFSAIVGRAIFLYGSGMLSHVAAFDILYGLRRNLSRKLGGLYMGYFTQRTSGEIKKIVNEDVERVELFVAHHIPDIVAGIILPIITISYLFTIDWRLSLIMLIPLPLAFMAQFWAFGSSRRGLMERYSKSMENMNGTIIEYIRGMSVVKVFGQTVHSFKRFKDSVYAYLDVIIEFSKKGSPPWAAFVVITNSAIIFILPFGVWFYIKGSLEIQSLLLFLILGAGYMVPLMRLATLTGYLSQINEGVKRIDSIIGEPDISSPLVPAIPENNYIEFCNVDFAYKEKGVLENISFKAESGSVTALVGPSGSGKTTIAQLLLRFWDIGKGDILIGGISIKDIPNEALMDKIGFVFQDAFMFSDTVYNNICMNKKGATKSDVIAAAKAAQAHDFIETLPDGYSTVIGEGGKVHLSGGERQRIAIARVILKDAPIIILDEATAFADPENEVKIQDAFSELMHDRTVIVIAHRLSTITDADQIIVLDEGRIVGKGKHEGLLESQNLYKNMWEQHTSAREWSFNLSGGIK